MNYLHWDEKTITDFSDKNISDMYDRGYVFTRKGRGVMQQTRSVRVDLSKFELSSENRRVNKKTEGLTLTEKSLPLADYTYQLGADAKYFYDTKFGPGVMSAQKIKEMLTDPARSNYNLLLAYIIYDICPANDSAVSDEKGFAICYKNPALMHYSYPFYHIDRSPKDMGMGMMIRAIEHAKSAGLKYIYLGSLQRPGDTYKLQFSGLEWFDGKTWQTDLEAAKQSLKQE